MIKLLTPLAGTDVDGNSFTCAPGESVCLDEVSETNYIAEGLAIKTTEKEAKKVAKDKADAVKREAKERADAQKLAAENKAKAEKAEAERIAKEESEKAALAAAEAAEKAKAAEDAAK